MTWVLYNGIRTNGHEFQVLFFDRRSKKIREAPIVGVRSVKSKTNLLGIPNIAYLKDRPAV